VWGEFGQLADQQKLSSLSLRMDATQPNDDAELKQVYFFSIPLLSLKFLIIFHRDSLPKRN
jgi:hypothetical protein